MFQDSDSETNPTPPIDRPSDLQFPRREPIVHAIFGSPAAVNRTIQTLQILGYAEVGLWSPPQPTQTPGEVVSILRRHLHLG
ncbi:MAG: hypothetical protein SWY16_07105 [Cyanobacteriota bacterium]|nr:hypothetical protein [Cyanobacteriota bacterium]